MKIFPLNIQQSSSNVSSQHVLDFRLIAKYYIGFHAFQEFSRFDPYHSYRNIGKNLDILEI